MKIQKLAKKNISTIEKQKDVAEDLVALTSSKINNVNQAIDVIDNIISGEEKPSTEVIR